MFTAPLAIIVLQLETIHMPVSRGMEKQTVVYPRDGILLSNKKDQTTETGNNMDESHGYHEAGKKPCASMKF